MYHGFDSRVTRNLDFSRLKYIGHISESFLWHSPTAQSFKISHSHWRDHSYIKATVIMSLKIVGSMLGGVNYISIRNE